MSDDRPGYTLIDDRWVPNHLTYMFTDNYEYDDSILPIINPQTNYVIVEVIKTWDRKIITESNYNKHQSKYKLLDRVEEYIKREGLAIGESGKSYMIWENGNIR